MKIAKIIAMGLTIALPAVCFAGETKFEECRQKLVAAQKLEVLNDLDWQKDDIGNPKVVVGPTYYKMPFKAKENFANTVNCFLMAGQPKYINFNLLDWQTGKPVGRYEYGRLKPL